MDNPISPEAMQRLESLYAELDAEIIKLGFDCTGCGRCCHFDEVDHTLFASMLEIDYLLKIMGKIAPATNPDRCPYQVEEKCHARDCRPLGCRLYFCRGRDDIEPDSETESRLDELSASFHERLKNLHQELNIRWNYQPFLKALAEKL